MQSALYYPFTGPESESFLKTALFLWDSVDFIVPHHEFHPYGKSADEQKALEIIGQNYVPTAQDQKNAHEELAKLCNGPLSDRFAFELEHSAVEYGFYPQKLLHETWEMLAESKLAHIISGADGVRQASTGPLFGYYMMTILAICCSGDRKRLVTDQSDPYRALANLLTDDAPSAPHAEDWHGRLIALTLSGPDFGDIPLKRLIEIRTQEAPLLKDLRRRFMHEVDSAAIDIAANADNPNVVRDRISSFTSLMEDDLTELKRALRRSGTSLLLSKEFGFSILAAASAATLEPITGTLATVGCLARGLLEYQDRRRKLLREHPSSWLLATGGPKHPAV